MTGLFKYRGEFLEEGPRWCMTEFDDGSMRFRWNESNPHRDSFLKNCCGGREIVPVELIHSKTVYSVSSMADVRGRQGDGIICRDRNIVPVVTVADCMPVYVFDAVTEAFAVLHSGWKGTGICVEAAALMAEKFGSRKEDLCFVLGPHIHSCCYNVDENRASYFRENFSSDSVSPNPDGSFALSLAAANRAALLKYGIPKENIFETGYCTCCHKENGAFRFGSFRREAASLPESIPLEERLRMFTVQAAFIKFPGC